MLGRSKTLSIVELEGRIVDFILMKEENSPTYRETVKFFIGNGWKEFQIKWAVGSLIRQAVLRTLEPGNRLKDNTELVAMISNSEFSERFFALDEFTYLPRCMAFQRRKREKDSSVSLSHHIENLIAGLENEEPEDKEDRSH